MNLTYAQMRHSARNLTAVATAIILGVAFVTITILAGGVLERSTWNAVAAQYDGADAVVTSEGNLNADTIARIRDVDGVATVEGRQIANAEVTAGSRSIYPLIANLPEAQSLRAAYHLTSGRLPERSGEVVMLAATANGLKVGAGDTITVSPFNDAPATVVTVTGIIEGSASLAGSAPTIYAWPDDVAIWALSSSPSSILITANPGIRDSTLVSGINATLEGEGIARTRDQEASHLASKATGDADILSTGLFAFAIVALFVAGIVIANTFTILVAQRIRSLALLRCVGATQGQIRRSVLAEASILGIISSIVGIVLGIVILTGGVRIYNAIDESSSIATDAGVSLRAIVLPLLLGIVATLIAAWGPAKGATQVAPLAALRPEAPEAIRSKVTARRILFSLALILGGSLFLGLGMMLAISSPGPAPMLVGIFGGMLSALGVLVGAVIIVPRIVGAMGSVVARFGGAPAAIAAANSTRNPKRTTATAMALLIAVTLVTMMSVGAESTKSTLNRVIDERNPYDLVVGTDPVTDSMTSDTEAPVTMPTTVDTILTKNPDVDVLAPVLGTEALLNDVPYTVLGVDPQLAREISRAPSQLDDLADGIAVMPEDLALNNGVAAGDAIELVSDGRTLNLVARIAPLPDYSILITPGDMNKLHPGAPQSQRWIRFRDGVNGGDAVGKVQDSLASVDGLWFNGGAEAKAQNTRILDTLLLIVTALLGVAVVIALLGVGNTLSLSVIERTRESAILRAMGLTRGQLRWMLAIEGVLIALVGAALGIILGIIYGITGALTLLGDNWGVSLSLPTGRLAITVVIAIVAGLLASVLPARKASRTSPVAALAE